MATGVKPRDEESQLTRGDLEVIQDAMKHKKFRELIAEYCEEVRDPANQELFQKEMTQLEKQRGYDVTFINPKGGYVIKTSVAGDRKAFINICSNDIVGKPSCTVQEVNGQKGMNWQLPYTIIPPREDYDHKKERCVIYDVVFHSDTLRMAEVNKQFRELVNKTAFEGLQKTYDIHLDSNNFRFPKSHYKGMSMPAVIRKEDPDYKPPSEDGNEDLTPEMIEKLYPQRNYSAERQSVEKTKPQHKIRQKNEKTVFSHSAINGYTHPKYVIKQQKNVDLQEFTYDRDSKQHSAIPSHIVVEINLPLISSTKDCTLDVQEKSLSLRSEKPAKYKLDISLPYPVNDECGSAKFDKSRRTLIVTLPVIRKNFSVSHSKLDSGLESEEYSHSDEDGNKENIIIEVSSTPTLDVTAVSVEPEKPKEEAFLDSSLAYIFPGYTYNVLDNILAFTFHVKNTDPDSVQVNNTDNKIFMKFTSVGAGFVPVHYAAIIVFDEHIRFENATGEAWDNNVILQLELSDNVPQKFEIGIDSESMKCEFFDESELKQSVKTEKSMETSEKEARDPVIEVSNFGNETSIVVSSSPPHSDYDEDDDSPTEAERNIVWTESERSESGAKSILRKPMMRSYSESSMGEVASSMDYISSDCIPEESSLKKTVRFSNVIAKKIYRYNSSIEAQKKKNQRKKSKKRSLERRKSESEAEDDVTVKSSKPRMKPVTKPRRDSGLADTSDAEDYKSYRREPSVDSDSDKYPTESIHDIEKQSVLNIVDTYNGQEKPPTIWESETQNNKRTPKESVTCDTIEHNTDLYNPDNLNRGQYQEVNFKNELIFDLDM